ncbi:unnamed protein product [Paramecium sonneborni]|uniref:Transmembrane protein n=1 Tax=Paramecium sonneborni TaxID=65129 RepID=A0A8S1QZN1_9CILI|nr:unnamed protein product [Paramecium sonneborni]
MNSKPQHQTNRKISNQEQIGNPKKPKNNGQNQFESQNEIRTEFIIRQMEYEELYKFSNSQSENQVNISERKDHQQNKFRNIINDAKLRYMNSYSQPSQYYIEKQESSIRQIIEQQRNQKRLLSKINKDNPQNTNQINLNLILLLFIPILCLIVLVSELFNKNQTII